MIVPDAEIGAFIAVLARAGGVVATAPVVGDGGVSVRVRLTLVVAITAAVSIQRPPVELTDVPMVALLELVTGALCGLVARFMMAPIAIAGQLSGLVLGLGFAAEYDPRAAESAGTLRAMTMALGGLAFLAVGGFEAIVRCVAAGPATPFAIGELGQRLIEHAASAFGLGVGLAGPIILAALVGNIGLALINRAAPAANVFAIALAAVLILGGVVMLLTAPGFVGGVSNLARAAADRLAAP